MTLHDHQPLIAFINAIEGLIGRDGMTGLNSEWKINQIILDKLREYGKVLIEKIKSYPDEFMKFGSEINPNNDLYEHALIYRRESDYYKDTCSSTRIIVNKASAMKSDAAKSLFMTYCIECTNGNAECISGIETKNLKWDAFDVFRSKLDDCIQWILLYNEYAKEFDKFIYHGGVIAFNPIMEINHIDKSDANAVNQYMLEYCMSLEVYHQYNKCVECFSQYAMTKILLCPVIKTD